MMALQSAPSALSDRGVQFAYFDFQLGHPDWTGACLLDFGGNRGDLLAGSGGAIDPSRYWNLDVSRQAVKAGSQRFRQGHFVHYNRWHHCYNPRGSRHEPLPRLPVRFDFILAFSVFTLIDEHELVELVTGLKAQLAEGGVLAFTFIDPCYRQMLNGRLVTNLEWRLEIASECGVPIDRQTMATAAGQTESCYLIERRWIERTPRLAFETFLTADHVRTLFPGCQTLAPATNIRHHCCVIRQ
jgi:hypothetical protein